MIHSADFEWALPTCGGELYLYSNDCCKNIVAAVNSNWFCCSDSQIHVINLDHVLQWNIIKWKWRQLIICFLVSCSSCSAYCLSIFKTFFNHILTTKDWLRFAWVFPWANICMISGVMYSPPVHVENSVPLRDPFTTMHHPLPNAKWQSKVEPLIRHKSSSSFQNVYIACI